MYFLFAVDRLNGPDLIVTITNIAKEIKIKLMSMYLIQDISLFKMEHILHLIFSPTVVLMTVLKKLKREVYEISK